MSFFNRLFKIGEANAHSAIDKFEDPIKMTEQGIRDLRKDLQNAMKSLAEVKRIAILVRKDAENNKKLAADYERKAMLLLQKMQGGSIDAAEAESLATQALDNKESHLKDSLRLSKEAEQHEKMSSSLQGNVTKIKSAITKYQNDLTTLTARSKTAKATKKINKQLSSIDSSATISMLEKMKAKVEEDESLAIAYGELADADKRIDDEIDAALDTEVSAESYDQLLELKKKMGIS